MELGSSSWQRRVVVSIVFLRHSVRPTKLLFVAKCFSRIQPGPMVITERVRYVAHALIEIYRMTMAKNNVMREVFRWKGDSEDDHLHFVHEQSMEELSAFGR